MQPVGGGTLVCEESTLGAIPIMVCNSDRRYVCPFTVRDLPEGFIEERRNGAVYDPKFDCGVKRCHFYR